MLETMPVETMISSVTWSSAKDAVLLRMEVSASLPYCTSGSVQTRLTCRPMSGVWASVSSFDEKMASHSLLSASPMPAQRSCSGESAMTAELMKQWFVSFG